MRRTRSDTRRRSASCSWLSCGNVSALVEKGEHRGGWLTAHEHTADALEALLGGRLTPEEFRRSYPMHTAGGELEAVLANIAHFLSDSDIRERDPRYKAMQEIAIQRLMSVLRSGDVERARRISLLRE